MVEPDITVVELSGRLALGRESQRIEALVEDLVRKGSKRVVMDLSAVDYIDSAGIGLVALSSGRLNEAGGRLVVVAPEGRVLQLLNMTQMNAIIAISATQDEALRRV